MNFLARIVLLTSLAAVPALAQDANLQQDGVEVDSNLFCDTQQQIERFAALFNSDQVSAEAAIAEINAENKASEACVIGTAAYRRAATVSTVRSNGATFDVMRIVVVGVYTINGMEPSVPTELYTMFPQDDGGTVGSR